MTRSYEEKPYSFDQWKLNLDGCILPLNTNLIRYVLIYVKSSGYASVNVMIDWLINFVIGKIVLLDFNDHPNKFLVNIIYTTLDVFAELR